MKKMIQLQVPLLEQEFNVWVPVDVPVADVCKTLSEGVRELSQNLYCPSGSEMLIELNGRRLLDPARTLLDYGVGNGDSLLLL